MPKGSANANEILRILREKYPGARYELDWTTPLELLVATILAAQCTDERVNKVTPQLFARYRTAHGYAEADPAELEELIKATGFFRQKAKTIQSVCRELVRRFGGDVPRTMAELVTLPGVARKTANVVLATAWNIPAGIIVDTHVQRVARRMGLTDEEDADRIERDLMRAIPDGAWTFFGPAMVLHGRYTCTARSPKCESCPLASPCAKRLEEGVTSAKADAGEEEPASDPSPAPARKAKRDKPASQAAPAPRVVASPDHDGAASGPKPRAGRAGPAPGGLALPSSWQAVLEAEMAKPYFVGLSRFVAEERREHSVFPPEEDVFNALALTPYEDVNVVLLGQDPYHDDGQAHGLCFSVRPGVPPPPSLVNMYKELQSDLGITPPSHGYLASWAEQGILMLNAVLTVRAHSPNSHKNRGWETFTDAVLRKVNDKRDPVVFVLWGGYAQKKAKLIDGSRHAILQSAHPSPLSARNGFFGSKPYSAINEALRRFGKKPIDWRLPAL
jgi:uracil-DNA glycosylase